MELPFTSTKETKNDQANKSRELADVHFNYETAKFTIKDVVDLPDKLDNQGKVIQRGRKDKFHKPLAPYLMEIRYLQKNGTVPTSARSSSLGTKRQADHRLHQQLRRALRRRTLPSR